MGEVTSSASEPDSAVDVSLPRVCHSTLKQILILMKQRSTEFLVQMTLEMQAMEIDSGTYIVVLGLGIRNKFFLAIGNSHNLSSTLDLTTLD